MDIEGNCYIGHYNTNGDYIYCNLICTDDVNTRIPRLAMIAGYSQALLGNLTSDYKLIDKVSSLLDDDGVLTVLFRNNELPYKICEVITKAWYEIGNESSENVIFSSE
jgi:hypothetical protein